MTEIPCRTERRTGRAATPKPLPVDRQEARRRPAGDRQETGRRPAGDRQRSGRRWVEDRKEDWQGHRQGHRQRTDIGPAEETVGDGRRRDGKTGREPVKDAGRKKAAAAAV